jgi:LAO/AO transport system kinase|tara:strand:- start:415 stop:1374 length:960 start_codon:yes stop_codon:yes gene_type:complete
MTGIDLNRLRHGDRRTLAKAITLVESKLDAHRDQAQTLLQSVLGDTGKSLRIGISGSPGVGKSTFIETFGLHLIDAGSKVAVLAVDPSSPIAGGSILADKTRMEDLSRQQDAFIRPSPSEGTLGGVAQKTRETMLLCEAAGYDVILVETVGVGQSEYEVAGMVDFFMVLMLPNAGDELQGIKKGIMELADALVINKADGDSVELAERTRHHFESAMLLLRHTEFWTPRVMTCSAQEKINLDAVWQMICDYRAAAIEDDSFDAKRTEQSRQWMHKLLQEMLALKLSQNPDVGERLPLLEKKVVAGGTTPYAAAKEIIDLL